MTTFDGRRSDYDRGALTEANLAPDPIAQLVAWLDDALDAGVVEHTAMSVSTVDAEGRPSSRVVLLRGIVDDGLVFFTGYDSAKASDLATRPECAALFAWLELQRQVRVTGRAERLDAVASDEYFASRPRGSQIGAWASPQSTVIADRAELEARVAEVEARFAGVEVPRPPTWGGYRIVASTPSSSGRAVGRGSTTVCGTGSSRAADGSSNASPPDPAAMTTRARRDGCQPRPPTRRCAVGGRHDPPTRVSRPRTVPGPGSVAGARPAHRRRAPG